MNKTSKYKIKLLFGSYIRYCFLNTICFKKLIVNNNNRKNPELSVNII